MADGSFNKSLTLDLDEATFARLEQDAALAGEPVAVFAKRLISEGLQPGSWAIAQARLDEYDRTGEALSVEEVFAGVKARLAQRLAEKS